MLQVSSMVLGALCVALIIFALAVAFHIVMDTLDEHYEKIKQGKI